MIKVLYNPNTSIPEDEIFFLRALKDIEKDGISSQIYILLKQQGRLSQTPTFFQKRLKEKYDSGLHQNLLIKNQTDLILKQFEDRGVDVVPLKGIYFAVSYFDHFGGRVTSDIDLLVRIQDLEKSIEIVKSLGFSREEPKNPGHFHLSLSKQLPHSEVKLVVELHWSIIRENTSSFEIQDFWEHASTIGHFTHIKQLSPTHTFYMICLHGWRHNLDSMKYFIDIIQVLVKSTEKIDFDQLIKLAASHQTINRLSRTLSIVYDQFPHLEKIYSIPFRRKKTLWKYHSVNRFEQFADFIDYQFLSYDTIHHSVKHFIIKIAQIIS